MNIGYGSSMHLCECFSEVSVEVTRVFTGRHEYAHTFPVFMFLWWENALAGPCAFTCVCSSCDCAHALYMFAVYMNFHVVLNIKFQVHHLFCRVKVVYLRGKKIIQNGKLPLLDINSLLPLLTHICIPYFPVLYITWCCQDYLKNSCFRSLPAVYEKFIPSSCQDWIPAKILLGRRWQLCPDMHLSQGSLWIEGKIFPKHFHFNFLVEPSFPSEKHEFSFIQ